MGIDSSNTYATGGKLTDGDAAERMQRWVKTVIEISAARNRPRKPFCCRSVDLAAFSIDRATYFATQNPLRGRTERDHQPSF